MAGIYNGYILEFPLIRIDNFLSPPPLSKPQWTLPNPTDPSLTYPAPPAQLYLLTHVHSDHLLGLSDNFTGKIICSLETKKMLLKLENENRRSEVIQGKKEVVKRKFEGLKAKVLGKGTKEERVVDIIEALPYGYPKEYQLGFNDDGTCNKVIITLLDANHCPGSTMFLITSPDRAILHTGDIRCYKLFIQNLRRNPIIQEFIALPGSSSDVKGKRKMNNGRRVLDRIYLDTGAMLGTGDMPDKEEALEDLIQHMSLYPEDTIFFLNVWCFGWEDVIKAVARHFDTKVHVDRYKSSIYKSIKTTDPFLYACTTEDHTTTRFHACERKAKCAGCRVFDSSGKKVYNRDKRIVSVNMVEVKSAEYVIERENFLDRLGKAAIGEGEWPYNILCPIARHSPLPELQSLVILFKPMALSPNTVLSETKGLDYYLLPDLFKDQIHPSAYDLTIRERDSYFIKKWGKGYLDQLKNAQIAGLDIGDMMKDKDSGMRDRMDIVGDPFALLNDLNLTNNEQGSGVIGTSRKINMVDQIKRMGGIQISSMTELNELLSGQMGKGVVSINGIPGMKIPSIGMPMPMPMMSFGKKMSGGDEYDTDEEDYKTKKRRRMEQSESEPSIMSLEMTSAQAVKIESSSRKASAIKKESKQSASSSCRMKEEVKVEPADIKPSLYEGIVSMVEQKRFNKEDESKDGIKRRISRFSVDKAHLRALAMVSED